MNLLKNIVVLLFTLTTLHAFSQKTLDSIFKKANITGVQIIAVDHGKQSIYNYGKTGTTHPGNVNVSTVFQAASLSKSVLAYIVLKMVDRKLISLDTPLYHYYQYPRIEQDTATRSITARMVLHHQTGFPNWAYNPMAKQWIGSPLKTNFTPGTAFSYSGEGFMYLQFAIEHILNESLEKIASREVFIPLGMTKSSFVWQPAYEKTGAYGHDKKGDTTRRVRPASPAAAFSLLTTAADYNLFIQALAYGNGLHRQTYQLMLADTASVKKPDQALGEAGTHISWALGLGVQRNEDGEALWHWGDNGDFKCFYIVYPTLQKSLVYFTNSENGLDNMQAVLDYYFGKHTWWCLQWLDKEF